MEQLGKLKSLLSKQEKEKVQILAVSVDTHEESKKVWRHAEQAVRRRVRFSRCSKIKITR